MKRIVGIYLDHTLAQIVRIVEGETRHEKIVGPEDFHHKRTGGKKTGSPNGPQDKVNQKARDRHRKQKLEEYYKKIIKSLEVEDHFLVMGPGLAKTELKKLFEKSKKFKEKNIFFENADKITKPQIVKKIKDYFKLENINQYKK